MSMSEFRIASRVKRIKPSPSSAAADRANELHRQGQSIVSLVVGEPDFDTPAHIAQAAWQAIQQGETRYTHNRGTVALRQAIVDKLARENDLHYGLDDIIVTNGAKSAIYLALAATLEANDEVIIPAPYWVSYPDMVKACDGQPITVPCPETHGFKLRPDQLEAAITPRTKWLLINSPSNPTGAAYTAEEYRALADVLLKHPQVMVMTDDIYEHIRFGQDALPHILNIEPRLRDRTLVINGVSKTYAMTGWRVGYAAAPVALINALGTLQSQAAGNPCSVSQAAAVEAFNGDQQFVIEARRTYLERRNRTVKLINDISGIQCAAPDGAFYLYINCANLLGRQTPNGDILKNDTDVVMYLLEHVGVAVVAGAAYGLSPYFRMSIAAAQETLDEGCARIAAAVADLHG